MDLIDREQLMNYIRSKKINIGKLAHDVIMKQPSIQPQEPKTGHWINIDDIESECSECGHREPNERFIFEDINFCAKCGAKMESEGK